MATANVANTYVVPDGTKVSPYYDDFDESKGFHRILFRPGYAVQARELTQLQTILQNQIERFGRHVFTNGSPVIGGDIFIPKDNFSSINLSPTYGESNTAVTAANFSDKTVELRFDTANTGVKFKVQQTSEATDTDPPKIYGTYISYDQFPDGAEIMVTGGDYYANVGTANSTTICNMAFLRDSVFFFNGYFVKVESQAVVLPLTENDGDFRVGLELQDEIITEQSDASLLDPAAGASNYQAPGAARYQMNLVLSIRTLESTDDSKFIELARYEDGEIVKQIKFPVYSEIEEVLARRTFDQSGNFTVVPFVLTVQEDDVNPLEYVIGKLSPGKAYIQGYEYETPGVTKIRIPKAKTSKDVTNYDLNLNYGNYVIVNSLHGIFDTSKCAAVDIHCIPHQFVNTSSNNVYQTTKIGTARVRDIEFYSGDVNVENRKYEFYLFDTNYRSIKSNANVVSTSTITLFNGTNLLSANNDAYANATLRVISGPGEGAKYLIDSYNGTTRTITTATEIVDAIDATSNVAIEFDFSVSECFYSNSTYTPGSSVKNANANIDILSKAGNVEDGPVFILEPSLNNLIFQYPDTFIKPNTIANMTYTYRKLFNSVSFNSGSSDAIVADNNEQFVGGNTTSNYSSSVMDNFLVVCTDKKLSSRSNGEMIKVTTSVSGDPEQVIFNSGASETFTAAVFAKMEFDPGVVEKTKTFVQANTSSLSTQSPVIFVGPTGSTANVYANASQVIIYNPSKVAGVAESLYISDVIGIEAIYDLNGATVPASGSSFNSFTNVTDRYELDNGQRSTHYDHASIKLKSGYAPCKGPLIVCFYYYRHSIINQGGSYFSVDSYPALDSYIYNNGRYVSVGYDMIPDFRKSDGTTINLRDCIDFRPTRENASNTFPGYSFGSDVIKLPIATTDFQSDYSYYLGRRDLITLSPTKSINRIEGVPAKYPQEPAVPNKSMVLYSINVPAYTISAANVAVKYVDNKRYTMRDIGKIDKRVENLEYYVSLNTLEKKAVDMAITDVNGFDRTKYGVFADSFVGHGLGATKLPDGNPNTDYKCNMDFSEGYMMCETTTYGFPLSLDEDLCSGVIIYKDKILLDHEEVEFVSQTVATKDAPIAKDLYAVFDGNILTIPEADIWKDTTVDPEIIVTDSNQIETTTINVYQAIVNSQAR